VTVKRQTAAAVAKAGLAVTLKASTPSSVKAVLTVDRKTAKKLRLKGSALGTGKGKAGPAGGKLTVKLTRAAKARLKKAKTVKAILVLTTTAPGRAPVVTRKPVKIG
jgi:hypothetical protein